MFQWLFKPVEKIKAVASVEPPEVPKIENIADEITRDFDVDEIVQDIIKSRSILCMHTESIEQLFTNLISRKEIMSSGQVGVSINSYFRNTGISPSECFIRLSKYINEGHKVPSKINDDLRTLYQEFDKLKSI